MSAPLASRAEGQDPAERPLAGEITASIVVFSLAIFFLTIALNVGFVLGDEGVAVMGARRISQGQIPHRDFFEMVPPGSFLPTALAFRLFGCTVVVEKAVTAVYALLLILLVDRILRRMDTPALFRFGCALFLIPFGVAYWAMPSHHWVADVFELASVLALVYGLEGRRIVLGGLGAGLAAGLVCFTLQDQGAYLVAAEGLLVFPFIADRRRRRVLFLSWSLGGAGAAAAFMSYLLPFVPPGDLWYQWVRFPAVQYRNIEDNQGAFLKGWEILTSPEAKAVWQDSPIHLLSLFAAQALIYLVPLGVIGLAVMFFLENGKGRATCGLLLAGCLAAYGTCAHRWAVLNLAWALPLGLVAAGWWSFRPGRAFKVRRGVGLAAAIVMGSVAFVYSVSYFAVAAGREKHALRGPAGVVYTWYPNEALLLQQVVDASERVVPKGDPVFFSGYMAFLNFITLRDNPTRYQFFMYPGYHTAQQSAEVIQSLEKLDRAWVFLPSPARSESLFDQHIISNYERVWSNPWMGLYLRVRPVGSESSEGQKRERAN